MNKPYIQSLKEHLFNVADLYVYAIIDSAVDKMIDGHFESDEPKKWILYKDEKDILDLELRAPHLIQLDQENLFTERIFQEGYGNNWGCFIFSEYHAEELAEHLKAYTKIYSQEHKQDAYIRFYDPRAMGQYFPCFTKKESQTFFSKITTIMTEKVKEPHILYVYSLQEKSSQVQRKEINLNKEIV